MKVVTVASHKNQGLVVLLRSCEKFEINIEVLGLGKSFAGNGAKIDILSTYLKTLNENEIVLFTDAFDSFFVRPIGGLLDEYLRLDQKVLFSVEDNYYFRIQTFINLLEHPWYRLRYPKSRSKYARYRFLNSGGFMGKSADLLELFETVNISVKRSSDQGFFHKYLIDRPGLIGLDYDHDIFSNYGKYANADRFVLKDGNIVNQLTASRPFLMHFPGAHHRGMMNIARQFEFWDA